MSADPKIEAKATEFRPYVPADQAPAEFTFKAVALGARLRASSSAPPRSTSRSRPGLTVSASIPVAVLSIAVFKKLGNSTILENNIVQTIGSAGESIAAGRRLHACRRCSFSSGGEQYFRYLQIMTLAAVGGVLGVLLMVPLRRSLIVKEHGNLPYPEGTACADVLIVGEKGGNLAKRVFAGVYTAIVYKLLMSVLGLWKDVPSFAHRRRRRPTRTPSSTAEITPEYLGVGYIIGPQHRGRDVLGRRACRGSCSSRSSRSSCPRRSASPTCTRSASATPGSPTTAIPEQIYRAYIRYIGAGAVACAGVMTLIKSLADHRLQLPRLHARPARRRRRGARKSAPSATCRSPSSSAARVALVAHHRAPAQPARHVPGLARSWASSSSSSASSSSPCRAASSASSARRRTPISGMTIATLMATCLVFVALPGPATPTSRWRSWSAPSSASQPPTPAPRRRT